jgi:hypothetical protein
MSIVTPEGVLSYPKVFRSELPHKPKPTDKKAWSTTILFDKEATATAEFKAMVDAAVSLAVERFGQAVSRKVEFLTDGPDAGRSFLRNGDSFVFLPFRNDVKKKGYPEQFVSFVTARKVDDPEKNIRPPEVIGRSGKPCDQRDIYPGVKARVSLGAFAYDNNGNKGVSFGLNNVLKVGDGDRIDNVKNAADEFGSHVEAADMPDELAAFAN